jgi:hypothetical protein
MMALLSIFLGLLFLYSLVSARVERTILTAPMLFTAAGILAALLLPGLREQKTTANTFLWLAEVGSDSTISGFLRCARLAGYKLEHQA